MNAVERFHLSNNNCSTMLHTHPSQQQLFHNASHPSIPVFMENLHRQIALVDMRVAAIQSGERREPSRAVPKKMERFSSIWAPLNESNVMLVLTQLANVRLCTGDTVTTSFRVAASSGSLGPSAAPSDSHTISNVQMDDVSQFDWASPLTPVPDVMSIANQEETPPLPRVDVEPDPQEPHHVAQAPPLPIAADLGRTIHIQESAPWLVMNVGYDQGRHGPHDVIHLGSNKS